MVWKVAMLMTKGTRPERGHAGGAAHHVLLGDAEVERALRERREEIGGAGRARQVGGEHDDLGVGGAELDQRAAVGFVAGEQLERVDVVGGPVGHGGQLVPVSPRISARAFASSSSLRAP